MNKLQQGGLAIVIKGAVNDSNVGKTVELMQYEPYAIDGLGTPLIDVWRCYCGEGLNVDGGRLVQIAYFESHRLLPIGNEPTTTKEKQDECTN